MRGQEGQTPFLDSTDTAPSAAGRGPGPRPGRMSDRVGPGSVHRVARRARSPTDDRPQEGQTPFLSPGAEGPSGSADRVPTAVFGRQLIQLLLEFGVELEVVGRERGR